MRIKKRRKRFLFVVLALVAIVVAVGFVYAAPLLAMSPTPTGEVAGTGILALSSGNNSLYFLPGEDGYIVVDAATNGDRVAERLPDLGIDPLEVGHVLLTHSDSDHVGALGLFANAQVYMGSDELQMINGTTRRNAFSRNALPEGIEAGGIVLLEDGQRVELGGRVVNCIAAPGHTPGSMAYLVDGQYLFTGDAFQPKDGSMAVHPFTMDSAAAGKSIGRLSSALGEAQLVLTAHYGWYESDTGKCGVLQ